MRPNLVPLQNAIKREGKVLEPSGVAPFPLTWCSFRIGNRFLVSTNSKNPTLNPVGAKMCLFFFVLSEIFTGFFFSGARKIFQNLRNL